MEVETAFRHHLMAVPAVRGYVQTRVFKHKLVEHVDGRGTRAVVVRRFGGWAEPERETTQEYPTMMVDCWADCSRNGAGEKLAEDAIDNAWAVYRAVDPAIHQLKDVMLGARGDDRGLYLIKAWRFAEPFQQTKDESHGGVAYGVELGESAVVSVEYALVVVH